MNRRFPLFEVLLVAILLVTLVACGGGKKSFTTSGALLDGASSQDKITRGTFSLVPKGDLSTESFSLSVEELGNGEVRISVDAVGAKNIPYALFELLYDSTRYSPGEIEFSEFFGTEDVLTAGITTKAGNVGLGVVPAHYDRKPGVTGSGNIVTVTFKNEPFRVVSVGNDNFVSRETPVVTGTGNDVGEINFQGATWREVLVGDGDLSGEVGIPDITPIALNYLSTDAGSAFADYDGDGEVGIPDITPIALNYLSTITGYNVYRDTSSTFNAGTATLDGTSNHADVAGNPVDAGGFLVHDYSFGTLPAPGETFFYFVVPFDGDGEALNCVSSGLEVSGEGNIPPDRFNSFMINVAGDGGFDEDFVSEGAGQVATFIANGEYTFTITGATIEKWNETTQGYDPPMNVGPADPDWNTAWEGGSLMWQKVGGVTGDFAFSSATGSGTVGTCGPNDPYNFEVRATLNSKVCSIDVSVELDPNAAEFVAVTPDKVEIPDLASSAFQLFCNLNDAGGTGAPEFRIIETTSGNTINIAFNATATSPAQLTTGQFYYADVPSPLHGTEHSIFFKGVAQEGTYRMQTKNRLGRWSSINQPPLGGTTPTNLTIQILGAQPPGANLRIFPIMTGPNLSRIVITPSNPRVQLYPAVYKDGGPPPAFDGKYRKYIRSAGDEFAPFRVSPSDPPNMHDTPWGRVYTTDPFNPALITPQNPLGFDASVPYIASSAIPENTIGGGPGAPVNDWNVKEWNRLILDVKDNTIFPPDTDYFVAVFQLPADWGNKIAIGKGAFRKQAINPPLDDVPSVQAFNEIHAAWSGGTEWPRVRFPDANGVLIDLNNPELVDPGLFIIASPLRPDAFFNPNPANPYDSQRNDSVRFTRDANGDNFVARVVTNEQPFSDVFLSIPKNSYYPTVEEPTSNPPGYTPPTLPGIGDPEVLWDDNDPGWVVLPFTEFNVGFVFGINPQAYISMGTWNAAGTGADRWMDGLPNPRPLTVIVPGG